MKVDSRTVLETFRPIEVVIRIESRAEMDALKRLCDSVTGEHALTGYGSAAVIEFAAALAPHVTAL